MTSTDPGLDDPYLLLGLPSELPAVERIARMPAGFLAGGLAVGIKASGRPDLALIAATGGPASAAAVYTANPFAAAPVRLSQAHLLASDPSGGGRLGTARAVVCTSGSANAATGEAGWRDQAAVAGAVAAELGLADHDVLTLSTGVIGTRLPVERVTAGIAALAPSLDAAPEALETAARAFMTTDSRVKVASVTIALPDDEGFARSVAVTGIAKGVGMIHPRMATMLAVVLTDATVTPAVLAPVLGRVAARTWDQLSVDGDTSTNDTVFLLASGAAGTAPVHARTDELEAFEAAVEAVARDLARQQAADGEGATTLITCQVSRALDDAEARAVARAVVSSSLVKAAVHGRDPNWGRVVAAAGNARLADAAVLQAAGVEPIGAEARAGGPVTLDPERLRVAIAGHRVFDATAGGPQPFDRGAARAAMDVAEVLIRLDLGLGLGVGEAFGCDLTERYVVENSEYTT